MINYSTCTKVKTSIFFALIIFMANCVFAQSISLKGRVSDSNGVPVLGATTILLNVADSAYVTSSVTNEKGIFTIKFGNQNKYILKITYVGYNTSYYSIDVNSNKDLNEFTIKEEPGKLSEVVVKGSRPVTEIKGGQINFNINEILAKTSVNAFSLLNKAPGVVISNSERLTILGQTNVLIKLNGKRAFSDVDDAIRFLKSVPAVNIDRIEIQNTTGAESESSYASVINIVLKEDLSKGVKGAVSLGASQGEIARYTGGATMTYINKKFNAYAIASYNHFALFEKRDRNQVISNYKSIYEISDNSVSKVLPSVEGVRIGLNYTLNKESSIGLVSAYTYSDRLLSNIYNTTFRRINDVDSVVFTDENSKSINNKFYTNFNYEYKKASTKLTLDINFLNDKSNINLFYQNLVDNSLNFPLNGYRFYEVNTASSLINLSQSFKNGWLFDLGGKFSYSHIDDNIEYGITKIEALDNVLLSNSPIRYNEVVGAGYLNASKAIKKASLNIGFRYEYAYLHGLILRNNTSYQRYFPNFLPTFSFNFPINEKHKVNLIYKQYLVRPNYSQLNPSILYVNPYTVSQGNINIRQYNSYSLTGTYSFLNKYILTARYTYNSNAVPQYILTRLNEQFTKVTYDNAISGGGIQATVYLPFTITKRWSSYNNINFFRLQYKTTNLAYTGFDYVNYNFNISSNNIIALEKNYSVGIDLSYGSRVRINQNTVEPTSSVDLQLNKSWFNQSLTASLIIQDIFYRDIRRGYAIYDNTTNNFYETADTRRIGFSVRYNFGKTKLANSRQRSTGLEDEENRAKYNVPVK